jgi:GWxTD domain-containing protein
MWRGRSIPLAILLVLLVWGCGSTTSTTRRDNYAYVYGKGGGPLQLQARVHNHSPEHSLIHYKLNTRDLLYKGDGTGGPYRAQVRIMYESYTDWSTRTLLDSASTYVQDRTDDPAEDKELIGSLEMRRNENRTFVLKITARDLNRESQNSVFLRVERDPHGTRQYFLPIDPATDLPLFDDHLTTGRAVKVRCDMLAGRTLTASHHPVDANLPTPVFTTGTQKRTEQPPDSLFTVRLDSTGTFLLQLDKPGVYHLRTDSARGTGYTLFVLAETYPHVGTGADMLRPLRYITSMQEFDRITNAANVRQAIEKFWLDAAGDRERAREAIRIYYSRVENANRHFTSHVEGWRTDRGLVHIIFGAPSSIYKTDLNETWIYGEENNLMSLTFNFTKRTSAFTDNDLVLERDPMLKGAWYRNVESWRNGRVYQN